MKKKKILFFEIMHHNLEQSWSDAIRILQIPKVEQDIMYALWKNPLKYEKAGMVEPGMPGVLAPPPPIFGSSVKPIQTRGTDYAHLFFTPIF